MLVVISEQLNELARRTRRIACELDSLERQARNHDGERLSMAAFARSSLEWSAERMTAMAREHE